MNNNQNVPNNGQFNFNNVSVIPNGGNNPQVSNMNNNPLPSGNVIPNTGTNMVNIPSGEQIISNNQVSLGKMNNTGSSNIPQNSMPVINNEMPTNTSTTQQSMMSNLTSEPTNTESQLNDMNVNGSYNKMEAPDYVKDKQVMENINSPKKNTITITKELKTIIVISLILLVFIIIMPAIFNLINNIRFR